MSNSVADIFAVARLVLDGSGFEAAAVAAGDKAGQSAGTKMSTQLNGKLKKAIAGALGSAVGGVIGMAASQGAQLDSVMRKFQADTGATDAEAQAAAKSIASMYENNIEGMAQIGDTLSAVVSGLHLSGQAAVDTAQDFLKYETATGQSAAAVDDVRGVLDAWDLTAADSKKVMDALVASHQQYHTNIAEDQDLLNKLAPTLKAANLTWEDGVSMLNMFTKAGISAEKIPTALTRALKLVKSPEELRKLLSDIGKIQDPFERAQKAAQVFGNRAGPQLAQALSKGGIADFAIDMDAATGATDRAAGAIQDSWGSRFTLLMHTAGGHLAEFGQSFGPLLLPVMQLGPKLTAGISAAFGGLSGILSKKIVASLLGTVPAAAVAGTTEGTATGAAIVAGEAATVSAGGPAIAAAVASTEGEVALAGASLGSSLGAALVAAIPAALVVALPAAIIGGIFLAGEKIQEVTGQSGRQQARFNPINGQMYTGANPTLPLDTGNPTAYGSQTPSTSLAGSMDASSREIGSFRSKIDDATELAFDGMVPIVKALGEKTTVAVGKNVSDQLDTIRNAKSAFSGVWSDAMDASARAIEIGNDIQLNEWQQADLAKQLSSKKLTAGQKRELQNQLTDLQAAHLKLEVEDANYGTVAERKVKLAALLQSKALKDGLKSTDTDTQTMWAQVQADTQTALDELTGIMDTGGSNAGKAFYDSLLAQVEQTAKIVYHLPDGTTYSPGDQGTGKPKTGYSSGGRPGYAEGGISPAWQQSFLAGETAVERITRLAGGALKIEPIAQRLSSTRQTVVQVAGLVRAETPEDIARVLRRAEVFG
jgi:hypothetical protein